VLLAMGIVLLQVRLWTGEGGYLEVQHLRAEISRQIAENALLESQNRRLTAEVQDLRYGMRALEERARTHLGMVGQDEVFYLMPDY
jgi:cell division protein FtsB